MTSSSSPSSAPSRTHSTSLPAETLDALSHNGFCLLPPFAPEEALRGLALAYDEAMLAGTGSAAYREASTTTRLFGLETRSAFDSIRLSPPLLEAAAHIIRGPFRLSTMLARTLRPASPAQPLHSDLPRDDPAQPMVWFIFMLDAFTDRNGATRFVPGSHRWPEVPHPAYGTLQRSDEVLACGPAGAMLVFDASIWHGHSANVSGVPRRSIQGYFVPRETPAG